MAGWWNRYLTRGSWAYLFLAAGAILLTMSVVLNEGGALNFRPEILAGKIIVIDPGHGGVDGGAVSALGDFEKEITLQIGIKLANRLRTAGSADVVLTRDRDLDYYTPGKGGKRNDLERRIEITQNSGAGLFISIHANAIKGKQWSGAQVFYHPGSEEGKKLAAIMQANLKDFPPGNKRKEKSEDYYILRKSTIPAVIVEVGFLSSPDEAGRLKNEGYQEQLAEAIFRGIVQYEAEKAGVGQ